MPAPQQSSVPVYKETSNIPRPNTAYHEFREQNSAGYALSKMLGAVPKAYGTVKTNAEKGDNADQSKMEQEQLAALGSMGAAQDRLKLAGGKSMFGIMKDPDSSMDAFQINRGRRDADLYAGKLRDAYAAAGLDANDDPDAFRSFVEQQQSALFGGTLKGVDPSYYHGFLTRVAPVYEDMGKAHAGHLDSFVTSKTKQAMETRIGSKVELELSINRERNGFGNFMDSIMGAESGGNYNAYHGHGNNSQLKFTNMTIGEVLDWQGGGEWRRLGAGSSAVGKYQFIESTLREVVRGSGIDMNTKFSPAVQDQLIQHRLMSKRGMQKFLDGETTAEQFLDNGLALEFAGLKKTNGRGHYDGDGLNKGGHASRKTIASLLQLREAYIKDPTAIALKKKAAGKKGEVLIGGDPENPQVSVANDIDQAEAEYGVPQTEARTAAATAFIKMMEANPAHAQRNDLDDIMTEWKLPQAERQRVYDARDAIQEEQSHKSGMAEAQKQSDIVDAASSFISSGNSEDLAKIKGLDPKVHQQLLRVTNNPPSASSTDEGFLDDANFGTPGFPREALEAYASGQIDKQTFTAAMRSNKMANDSKPVLALPGVRSFVTSLRDSLPMTARKDFDAQLAMTISDLTEDLGKSPALKVVLAEARELHGILSEQAAASQQSLMDKYNISSR